VTVLLLQQDCLAVCVSLSVSWKQAGGRAEIPRDRAIMDPAIMLINMQRVPRLIRLIATKIWWKFQRRSVVIVSLHLQADFVVGNLSTVRRVKSYILASYGNVSFVWNINAITIKKWE
jgi:hypothetical protein